MEYVERLEGRPESPRIYHRAPFPPHTMHESHWAPVHRAEVLGGGSHDLEFVLSLSCHCPVTVPSEVFSSPLSKLQNFCGNPGKRSPFPVGTQTFPHTSINNLARCKVAYAGTGVGWALKGICARGVVTAATPVTSRTASAFYGS